MPKVPSSNVSSHVNTNVNRMLHSSRFPRQRRVRMASMHFMNRKTPLSKQIYQDLESYASKLTPCKDEVTAQLTTTSTPWHAGPTEPIQCSPFLGVQVTGPLSEDVK